MNFESYFPIMQRLTVEQQEALRNGVVTRHITKGTVIHRGSMDCLGLLVVRSGQFRAHIANSEGREITLYRLFERDVCLFTASCIMRSIQFDIIITAEKDSEAWIIPPKLYKALMEQSAALANYTAEIMGTRFTEVMWLIEQIMWKSVDRRLAGFLCEECVIEGTALLKITHEQIADHLGTAREVVTRMLKYFQTEGLVKLTRGSIEVLDEGRLRTIST
jgi:CRP/FNR family transcriptional regulator